MEDYIVIEGLFGQIIQRTSDGAFTPTDERNSDYQQCLKWLEANSVSASNQLGE